MTPSPADTMPLESAVPMPPHARAVLYFLLMSVLTLSLYICIQAGMMIHTFHQTLEWVGELAER